MQNDTLRIKINIDGKSYTLNIAREKEEIFRRAEKEINHLIASIQSQYQAEREDYISVIAMEFAVKALTLEMAGKEDDTDDLKALEHLLDEHLNKIK